MPSLRGRLLLTSLFLASSVLATHANTLRWAGRGDIGSLDPHALNEGQTINLLSHIYERLVRIGRDGGYEPSLAASWAIVDPLTWQFVLRPGVRFSDGTLLTTDDVLFSIERACQTGSQFAYFARKLGRPVRIDDATVEFQLDAPNPALLHHVLNVAIMSRAWATQHGVIHVPQLKARDEGYSATETMGTGPFLLRQRERGGRTVLARNPLWWDRFVGNVSEVIYLPMANDATRNSALLAGDVDFTHEAPSQDAARLASQPQLRLSTSPENRVIYFGFDQWREELLYSSVKGRNPFRDARVREAFVLAVDAEQLKRTIMDGRSTPTGCMTPSAAACMAPELESRTPTDIRRARELMSDAGYPDGFDLNLDCPNDRYVNDHRLCVAMAAMLSRIGVRLKVELRPKTVHFQRLGRGDTSFYMQGWGSSVHDPQALLDSIVHSKDAVTQKGGDNHGRIADAELDRLIDAAGMEMDAQRRATLIAAALKRTHDHFYYLPLHRQMLLWVSRANVRPVVTPDNIVRLHWIQVD